MSAFAETLRRIRFERHMTQEEFAELLGTTKQNISRYESGAVSPKISTAAVIAEKLGISLSELSGDTSFIPKDAKQHRHGEKITSLSRSKEWKVLSEGFERMEQEQYDKFMAYFNMLKMTNPEFFDERNDDDANNTES